MLVSVAEPPWAPAAAAAAALAAPEASYLYGKCPATMLAARLLQACSTGRMGNAAPPALKTAVHADTDMLQNAVGNFAHETV